MVSKEARNYVAKEIEHYQDTKKEMESLEREIISGHAYSRAADVAATVLVTHNTLKQMRNFVDTFESIYNRLTDEKQRMIQLLYWSSKDYNCNGVGMTIGVDGSTVGRWRVMILNEIAEQMGLK